ncbi:succinate dehydrogenase, cytochrome b556 subunit [Pelagibacteraceae bacterium]|nr:succinate dehydrogenase, cytochrome b556 subunit [Pelagibacteraceae bacterium]
MKENQNPISPHLQVYRWHVSSLLSITHRIAGVINLLALILIFVWLSSLNLGEYNYELFLLGINTFFGKFILITFTWSMSFHILSGIRHLAWDMGYGFEIKTANISGIIVIIFSLVITIMFWLLGRGLI